MDFKLSTKKQWDVAMNGNTWIIITKYCIPRSIGIGSYKNDSSQSIILIKLVLVPKYDIYLKDSDIDYINLVAQSYVKVFRVVVHWLQYLQSKRPEEIQLFQDTRSQPIWIFNPVPPTSIMTAMNIGQFNIQNKCNDY